MPVQPVERKLAAIFAADIAGYSRLDGARRGRHTRPAEGLPPIIDGLIASHRGRIFNTAGDSVVADFASAVDAVQCAVAVQAAIATENAGIAVDEPTQFRIGVHVGDVMVDGDNLLGDGVNIAARLESLAEPGGISLSEDAFRQVCGKIAAAEFADVGEQSLKNIARPVHIYALSATAVATLALRKGFAALDPTLQQSRFRSRAPRLSIVVLPFANLSNDPEQEYFADGITDDLTTDLSRISQSFVIARNTAFTFKGKAIDTKQVGQDLGIQYILEGSVRRSADQVRVNVQLVDAKTGAHLWADRFDTDLFNLAQAQDEITGRLAQSLNLQLVEDVVRRIEQERTSNPDARDQIMRGWFWYYRTISIDALRKARQAFEKALELDRELVDARIGIASLLVRNVAEGWSVSHDEDEALAEKLLREALERDVNHPNAHYALGMLRRVQNCLDEARMGFETTITLDQNHARSYFRLGQTLMFVGRPEDGIPHITRSIRLSPRDPNIARPCAILGFSHLLLGHTDEAIDLLWRARSANSNLWWVHLILAGALSLKGEIEGARAALAEAMKLKPEVNSIAQWHATHPWSSDPRHIRLNEPTLYAGLRRIGFPDI